MRKISYRFFVIVLRFQLKFPNYNSRRQRMLFLRVISLCALFCSQIEGQQISVGRNVQVSQANSSSAHGEVLMAIDPKRPERMMASSMVSSIEDNKTYTVVYTSIDSGATWKPTLSTLKAPTSTFVDLPWLVGDPSQTFGRNGTAYFAVLAMPPRGTTFLYVYHSLDRGITWSDPVLVPGSLDTDRSYIIADDSNSKYSGRIYVIAQTAYRTLGTGNRRSDLTLYRSLDQGKHFDPPARLAPTDERSTLHPGNAVILSDGTLVSALIEIRRSLDEQGKPGSIKFDPRVPNAKLHVVKSEDGGDTLSNLATIADVNIRWPRETINSHPSLAVDRYSKDFNDRLYVTWADTQAGRTEIFFSYSTDRGKSWIKPKTINDNHSFESSLEGPDDFMPSVAVNNGGVVGIVWYDRRNSPDNIGWEARFTASLDGGDTFLPTVRVSEAPMAYGQQWSLRGFAAAGKQATSDPLNLKLWLDLFSFDAGHTGGMAAGAKGIFYPLWIDNRTGTRQVWTAPVKVEGVVSRNGSEELARFSDASSKATLILSNMIYDPNNLTVSTDAELKNLSQEILFGPIKLRALRLQSEMARKVEIMGADNGMKEAGAVWDLTQLLVNNQLKPGEISKRIKLSFKLSGLIPPKPIPNRTPRPIMLDARILAERISAVSGF
jgi:hypothetical protein